MILPLSAVLLCSVLAGGSLLEIAEAGAGPTRSSRQGLSADSVYGCIVCHSAQRRAFAEGIHSERGIRCHDCHGGDPAVVETVRGGHASPFLGSPDKLETVQVCGTCHSDPDRMRPFGLPADEVAELRTSRHGQLLFRGETSDAPTCTDCHSSHTIRPPEDIRSDVYPTNIVPTCAECHADPEMMDRHGLPTAPVELYLESQHGEGLYERRNLASPTCVSCHGSHSALTAGGTAIADVCGRCHALARQAFYEGPHGPAALAGEMPGCLSCHSNHGTERMAAEEVTGLCLQCHESGSQPAQLGTAIQEQLRLASDNLRWAEEAIEELVRSGRDVYDSRFRYQTARTDYLRMGPVQHRLEIGALEDLARRVGSISRDIRDRAEVAEEQRWEHRLLLIPIWFFALAASVLAWFRLRAAKAGERE